jgi:hypothetical protein
MGVASLRSRELCLADFARYSISANNDGSTQIPRCAIFLL